MTENRVVRRLSAGRCPRAGCLRPRGVQRNPDFPHRSRTTLGAWLLGIILELAVVLFSSGTLSGPTGHAQDLPARVADTQTLRRLKWTVTRIKTAAAQILTSWHLPSRHRPCGRCPRVSASDQISARELSSCLAGWLIARRSACWTWSAPRSTSPIINFGQWRRDRVQLHLTTPSRVENQPMSCAMVRRGIDRSPATARACLRSSQHPSSVTRYALCQPA